MKHVETYLGPVDSSTLGVTLLHEHIFVRDRELELNLSIHGWDPDLYIPRAIRELRELHVQGVRTIVDLTVPGLGRDVRTIAAVASDSEIQIVASTGWYAAISLPLYFRIRGVRQEPGGIDELAQLFIDDILTGIAGTSVRAGMLKCVTDVAGINDDVTRIMRAVATAHLATGVSITTHSHPPSRNGLDQQRLLRACGVPLERVVIGHSGDSDDLGYLRALMDAGSTIGMDRFGMEHVLADERRVRTVLALLRMGYADRMILSQDAAIYSHVTQPEWRARHTPRWRMTHLMDNIVPMLKEGGATELDIHQMLVVNPRHLLQPASISNVGTGAEVSQR